MQNIPEHFAFKPKKTCRKDYRNKDCRSWRNVNMEFLIWRENVILVKICDVFYFPYFCRFLTMVIFRKYTSVAFRWVKHQWDRPLSKYFTVGNAQMNLRLKFSTLENWKVCITMKKKQKKKQLYWHFPFLVLGRNIGHVRTVVTQSCSVIKLLLKILPYLRKKNKRKSSILIRVRSQVIYFH